MSANQPYLYIFNLVGLGSDECGVLEGEREEGRMTERD